MEKTVQGWDSRSCPIIRFEKEFNPCDLHFYIMSWKEFNPFTFISMLRDKPKNLTHAASTFILGSILRDKLRQRLSRLEKRKSKKP